MDNFNLIIEANKLGITVKGNQTTGKPVIYENKDYFFTENFHPEELKAFIIQNKQKITLWCIENDRNTRSALLGY